MPIVGVLKYGDEAAAVVKPVVKGVRKALTGTAKAAATRIVATSAKLSTTPIPVKQYPQLIDDIVEIAQVIDRGELTVAGRSLTKHGIDARPGNRLFPAATGSPKEINEQAARIVREILEDPGTTVAKKSSIRFGEVLDVIAPDGRGLRYDAKAGQMIHFTVND